MIIERGQTVRLHLEDNLKWLKYSDGIMPWFLKMPCLRPSRYHQSFLFFNLIGFGIIAPHFTARSISSCVYSAV